MSNPYDYFKTEIYENHNKEKMYRVIDKRNDRTIADNLENFRQVEIEIDIYLEELYEAGMGY